MWLNIFVFIRGRGTIVAGLIPNTVRVPVVMAPTTDHYSSAPLDDTVGHWVLRLIFVWFNFCIFDSFVFSFLTQCSKGACPPWTPPPPAGRGVP